MRKTNPTPTATFRYPGHLADCVLRSLSNEKQESSDPSASLTASLNATRKKLLDVLALLLHKKSQTNDPGMENFYAGNVLPHKFLPYGPQRHSYLFPCISSSYYEIAREYYIGKISGKHICQVKNALKELSENKVFFSYIERSKKEGDNLIESYAPLIALKETEGKTGRIEIIFDPIFRSQIDKKWITVPIDIVRRTSEAYGDQRVSRVTLALRNYLLRVLSGGKKHLKKLKKEDHEVGLQKLYRILSPNEMAKSRKGKIGREFYQGVEVMKRMGILLEYSEADGKLGKKAVFKMNWEWI